jgi:phosphate uptake regulator
MKEPARISRHFIEELDDLKQRLVAMGRLVEERIQLAMRALLDRDLHLTRTVIEADAEVDGFQVEIDDRCFTLLALQQPMASDLRSLVAPVKINSDLEVPGTNHAIAVFSATAIQANGDRLIAWMRDIVALRRSEYVPAIGRFSDPPQLTDPTL